MRDALTASVSRGTSSSDNMIAQRKLWIRCLDDYGMIDTNCNSPSCQLKYTKNDEMISRVLRAKLYILNSDV